MADEIDDAVNEEVKEDFFGGGSENDALFLLPVNMAKGCFLEAGARS